MTPESKKKLEALSVEDKAVLDLWCSAHTRSESIESFLDLIEGLAEEPYPLESALAVGRAMVKAGIGPERLESLV